MRWRGVQGAALAVALVAGLLGGCHREPSFDERYASAQGELRTEAAEIDSELTARTSEAAAADAALGSGSPSSHRAVR